MVDGNNGLDYAVTTATNSTGVITAAPLTITAVTNTKVYDSTVGAAATPTFSGLKGSDSITNATETYDTKNTGTAKTLSVASYTVVDGNSGLNYAVTTATNSTGVITAAPLTITAATNSRPYDATITAAAIPTASGLRGTDSITATETYDTKNAGTAKTLSVASYTVVDGNNGLNYAVTTAANSAGVITAAPLTITAAPNNKPYDATITAAATPTASGLKGTDSITNATETYDTKNAGVGKTLSVASYTVVDGNSGLNYAVTTATNSTGVITAAPLTITAATNSKPYDATITAAAIPTASGLKATDSITNATETYDTKNAGTAKTLSVASYTVVDGNSGLNYAVTTATNSTGVITAVPLTITAVTNSKPYDGTNSAAATPTSTGLKGSDALTATETYDTGAVGTGKTMSVATYNVNDGNGGANYSVSTATNTTGVITALSVTPSVTAAGRPYDGTTTATVSTCTLTGVLTTDLSSVTCSAAGANFTSASAGTWTVNATGITLSGTPSINYVLSSTTAATMATIGKISASVTLDAKTKVYDGLTATDAPLTGTLAGFLPADNVTATFSRAAGETVGAYAISAVLSPSGVLGNYNITNNPASFTITQAQVTPSITAYDKPYDGSTSATVVCALAGVAAADAGAVGCVPSAANFASMNAVQQGVLATGIVLSGAASGNYSLSANSAATMASIAKSCVGYAGFAVQGRRVLRSPADREYQWVLRRGWGQGELQPDTWRRRGDIPDYCHTQRHREPQQLHHHIQHRNIHDQSGSVRSGCSPGPSAWRAGICLNVGFGSNGGTSVETSLDTAGTSARATNARQ